MKLSEKLYVKLTSERILTHFLGAFFPFYILKIEFSKYTMNLWGNKRAPTFILMPNKSLPRSVMGCD